MDIRSGSREAQSETTSSLSPWDICFNLEFVKNSGIGQVFPIVSRNWIFIITFLPVIFFDKMPDFNSYYLE